MKLKFLNYATIIGFCFVLVQQIIVATSTVMIAKLSQAVVSGDEYRLWLILFIISLTVVYIPTTLTNYFINKAKYITYSDYIKKFSVIAYNHPHHFFNSNFRERKESYFTHEAWLIIQEDYNFFVDMFSLLFNVGLNVLVLSYYLNTAFLFSYICAIPLTILCVSASKPILRKWSDSSQKSRNAMLQTLYSGWDTILTGNIWNVFIWKNNFMKKCITSDKNQRKLTLNIDLASIITLFVSASPILIVLFMSFMDAVGDAQMLAVLVATTPRQITTIQHLSDTIGLFINLNDKIRRTRQVSYQLNFSEPLSSQGKISWGSLMLTMATERKPLNKFDDLITYTNDFSKGRYTITGDNGSGKTTLLAEVKVKLGDKAYILPSQSKMVFLNETDKKGFSTGEKAIENLKEIAQNVDNTNVSVLLLDEWNANLDNDNMNNLSNI
ncbi:MAG: AAA family ATPase, partial [Treponema sp.]|nr:AAA family ATPase [Treponema sp.]